MMGIGPILAGENLSFGYPGRRVGQGVSLGVKAGEVLALLGPNGGGKTTLLKTLIGLLAPQAGRVVLEGKPLADFPVTERARRIGYVPQAHAGAFAFSVRDVVLMGRTAHQGLFASPSEADRALALAKLGELGIAHLAEQPYTMISGGERQLVLIARALAQEPRVIVLDEPTASLDFGNQGKVLRQIAELKSRGLAVLFTTHDPNHALRHADRVALLGRGALLAEGPPAEMLTVESLAALYGAAIHALHGSNASDMAFLPA
ncbi:MAG: ABC transporter ATP-binding protein [Beijerinckiaceae bacterium]|jgi:iron complex transport system ATP-binding protein|nr:ABC transporter ATP-binding protein [Beijerinckiaceae bacterium]